MLALTITATKPAISIPGLEKAPELAKFLNAPPVALGGALVAVAFVVFLMLLTYLFKAAPKPEPKKEDKNDELHLHIKELKEALVAEMRGTSKQNWIMIWLTLIFIVVTLFSGSIIVLFNKLPNLAADTFSFFKAILGR